MLKFHNFRGMPNNIPNVKNAVELQEKMERYTAVMRKREDLSINDRNFRMGTYGNMIAWKWNRRPYYSVYPKIVDALLKTKLTAPVSAIHIPTETNTLLIRLAHGHELGGMIDCIFCGIGLLFENPNKTVLHVLATRIDGLIETLIFSGDPDKPLEDVVGNKTSVKRLGVAQEGDNEIYMGDVVRLILGIGLLEADPELIVPDVLEDDKRKLEGMEFDPALVARLHEKAQRRGKHGWIIGECTEVEEIDGYEVSAHYRRSHFGFRWSGPGKTKLKLTKIKGSIIHREKLTEVPTGYLDNETKGTIDDSQHQTD